MSTGPHGIADDQVRSAFQRWKNLEEEKARIGDDLKELFAEQKAFGHDTKAMRAAFRLKVKMDEARPEDAEHEALVDTYLAALEPPRASRAYARENIVKSGTINGGVRTDGPAIDFGTAKIMDEQRETARRSDGGLSILTKHEDIRTTPVTAEEICRPANPAVSGGEPSIPSTDAGGVKMDGRANDDPGRPDVTTSGIISAKSERATNTISQSDDGAIAAVNGKAGLANADGVEPPSSDRPSDQPGEGGADEVTSSAPGAGDETQTSNAGEGAANTALPANGVKMEYCPPTGVKRSSFAHCFPEPSKDQRAALERDIIDNRVQVPVIRKGNVILDGWTRYTIARSLGQNYPVKEYDGDDELLEVIEWQRASRNFTPAQEKKIAADLAKAMPDRADEIMTAFGMAEALEAAE